MSCRQARPRWLPFMQVDLAAEAAIIDFRTRRGREHVKVVEPCHAKPGFSIISHRNVWVPFAVNTAHRMKNNVSLYISRYIPEYVYLSIDYFCLKNDIVWQRHFHRNNLTLCLFHVEVRILRCTRSVNYKLQHRKHIALHIAGMFSASPFMSWVHHSETSIKILQ